MHIHFRTSCLPHCIPSDSRSGDADMMVIHQVDYSNQFLQGILICILYMTVPCFMESVPKGKVILLLKSLYGLREAPHIWNILVSKELLNIGFNPFPSAPYVFVCNRVMVSATLMIFSLWLKIRKSCPSLQLRLN